MVLLYIQLRCTFLHPPPVCRVPNGCSCCLALFTFVINFPPCLSFLLSPCSPGDPHPQSPVCPGCPLTLQCDCHLVHFFHCHQEFGLEAQFSKPHKLLFYSFFFFNWGISSDIFKVKGIWEINILSSSYLKVLFCPHT